MAGDPLFTLSILFSLITGTAASLLALLTLEILRQSPFGRAVFALSVAMALFVIYHVTLLLSPGVATFAEIVKSVIYTGVTAFVWTMVWSQYRMRRRMDPEVNVR